MRKLIDSAKQLHTYNTGDVSIRTTHYQDVSQRPLFFNSQCERSMQKDAEFLETTFSVLDGRLPRSGGVYAVVVTPKWDQDSTPVVVYIGSAHDLYNRFRCTGSRNHVYRRLKSLLKGYSTDILYKEVRDHYNVEIGLIKKYRPRFNKVHK